MLDTLRAGLDCSGLKHDNLQASRDPNLVMKKHLVAVNQFYQQLIKGDFFYSFHHC